MAGLWNRFWTDSTSESFEQGLEDKAEIAYLNSQLDADLLRGCYAKIKAEPHNIAFLQDFLAYQELALAEEKNHSIASELALMERYVTLFQKIAPVSPTIVWTRNVEAVDLEIPRFILLPLVQNALWQGYHAAEKYPMKIKLSAFEKVISLDITNHVNHHIADQKSSAAMTNYQTRLQVTFGEQQSLLMNSNAHTFRAYLTLRF